jgi:hypothetical protein
LTKWDTMTNVCKRYRKTIKIKLKLVDGKT